MKKKNSIFNKEFLISIFAMLGLQFITYMLVKLFQTNYHSFNFDIDNKIPFIPQVIIIYNLFYPAIFIIFYTIFNKDKDTYYKGIISGILGFIIADIIYLICPVEMIRPDITNLNIDPINKYLIYLTYKYDYPAINCFPSMHCIFCFNTIYTLYKTKDYNITKKVLYILLLLFIATTTLLVKQHCLVDVISALIIVIITNILTNIFYKIKK